MDSDRPTTIRTMLETLKEQASKMGWTLEQTADLFDAFIAIQKDGQGLPQNTKEWAHIKGLISREPKGKQ